jgi:hypothetical protein
MIDDREATEVTSVDKAWDLFEQTGNVEYYLMYKRLSREKR